MVSYDKDGYDKDGYDRYGLDRDGHLSTEEASRRLIHDRLCAIEMALGLPSYGNQAADISERQILDGQTQDAYGVLWPDCNGEPECFDCARKTLLDPDPTDGSLLVPGEVPTGLLVWSRFTCRCQRKAVRAS